MSSTAMFNREAPGNLKLTELVQNGKHIGKGFGALAFCQGFYWPSRFSSLCFCVASLGDAPVCVFMFGFLRSFPMAVLFCGHVVSIVQWEKNRPCLFCVCIVKGLVALPCVVFVAHGAQ